MSRKNVLKPYKIASAQSMAVAFQTPPTLILFADNVSYQINITTTNSTGTFAVQVSNDYAVDEVNNIVVNPGTWDSLTLSGTPVAAGANDSIVIDLHQLPFNAVRLAYTPIVAGTGTADVYIMHKQVGG
jgi:hypothetical protein